MHTDNAHRQCTQTMHTDNAHRHTLLPIFNTLNDPKEMCIYLYILQIVTIILYISSHGPINSSLSFFYIINQKCNKEKKSLKTISCDSNQLEEMIITLASAETRKRGEGGRFNSFDSTLDISIKKINKVLR